MSKYSNIVEILKDLPDEYRIWFEEAWAEQRAISNRLDAIIAFLDKVEAGELAEDIDWELYVRMREGELGETSV